MLKRAVRPSAFIVSVVVFIAVNVMWSGRNSPSRAACPNDPTCAPGPPGFGTQPTFDIPTVQTTAAPAPAATIGPTMPTAIVGPPAVSGNEGNGMSVQMPITPTGTNECIYGCTIRTTPVGRAERPPVAQTPFQDGTVVDTAMEKPGRNETTTLRPADESRDEVYRCLARRGTTFDDCVATEYTGSKSGSFHVCGVLVPCGHWSHTYPPDVTQKLWNLDKEFGVGAASLLCGLLALPSTVGSLVAGSACGTAFAVTADLLGPPPAGAALNLAITYSPLGVSIDPENTY